MPNLNLIYKLCIDYTDDSQFVKDNYNEVLTNFFRFIESYDPSRPITTWLHICTKRYCRRFENKRHAKNSMGFTYSLYNPFYDNDFGGPADGDDGSEDDEGFYSYTPPSLCVNESASYTALGVDNWREYYNPDIVAIIDEMKPIYKDAVILKMSGYNLKEIMEIEFEKGSLKHKNIETVKSRIHLAKKYLKERLTRDGQRTTYNANNDPVPNDSEQVDFPEF